MILRSYARAFATNRRIYRIDRWAVPIPGGLPLAASAWFLALAITLIGLAQLPGVNAMASVVWLARDDPHRTRRWRRCIDTHA